MRRNNSCHKIWRSNWFNLINENSIISRGQHSHSRGKFARTWARAHHFVVEETVAINGRLNSLFLGSSLSPLWALKLHVVRCLEIIRLYANRLLIKSIFSRTFGESIITFVDLDFGVFPCSAFLQPLRYFFDCFNHQLAEPYHETGHDEKHRTIANVDKGIGRPGGGLVLEENEDDND